MFMKPSLNSGMPSGQMLGWQNEGYLHAMMMMTVVVVVRAQRLGKVT